ncbi:replication protein [Acinetobacter sp. R933-2]|uniref:replication protein n=1 Tax=Acinetobacter sp. R933-2 TaxID=2746728 RepID=UPI002574C6C5|nr:replication protein [Acinetobacter sp. R933-2]MDM1247085.1 replication protein [Acinetobacter sp. R933-2]
MSIAEVIPFRAPDPQIEEVIVDTEDKNDGYTPLPNFICDEGYLAALGGDAVKCLIFLNRHIIGFHIENKSMSEDTVVLITGIKDKRTIRKCMAELARFNLVTIEKEDGKKNTYFLHFESRISPKAVASHVPTLSDKAVKIKPKAVASHVTAFNEPVASHVTTPVACDVPTTSDMACHPLKEIDLKENIKKDEEEAQAKFQAQNRQLNFVQYHTDDRTQISFPELCKKYSAQIDFQDQARVSFPDHSPNRIFENLKKMAQWSLDKSNHTPQKWMTIWLDTFMKNLPSDSELAAAEARKQQKSQSQTPKAEKQKRVSRFGKYLKPQQGEIYDV